MRVGKVGLAIGKANFTKRTKIAGKLKKNPMSKNIKVLKNEANPETPEILAASIIKIADAFERLMSTKELADHAIVALLKDMPGMQNVGKTEIRLVLDNLKRLKGYYVRSVKK
jgi:hypothetical protein